jgi:mRNA-degrading endonuclease RelE of RelBE toxin-antitoxin system
MSYSIIILPEFKKQAKRLSKKYSSLKTELSVLFDELEQTPTLGTPISKDV